MSEAIEVEVRPVLGEWRWVAEARGQWACGLTEDGAIRTLCARLGYDGYEEVETTNEPEPDDLVEFSDEDGYDHIDVDSSARHEQRHCFDCEWQLLSDDGNYARFVTDKADAVRWVDDGVLP